MVGCAGAGFQNEHFRPFLSISPAGARSSASGFAATDGCTTIPGAIQGRALPAISVVSTVMIARMVTMSAGSRHSAVPAMIRSIPCSIALTAGPPVPASRTATAPPTVAIPGMGDPNTREDCPDLRRGVVQDQGSRGCHTDMTPARNSPPQPMNPGGYAQYPRSGTLLQHGQSVPHSPCGLRDRCREVPGDPPLHRRLHAAYIPGG